jgi:hypothetical protein
MPCSCTGTANRARSVSIQVTRAQPKYRVAVCPNYHFTMEAVFAPAYDQSRFHIGIPKARRIHASQSITEKEAQSVTEDESLKHLKQIEQRLAALEAQAASTAEVLAHAERT